MLTVIRDAWAWTGLIPVSLRAENEFGNIIVRASNGAFWRICPEMLSCEPIAADDAKLAELWTTDGFQLDWRMSRLVAMAETKLGGLAPDRCYCMKIPAILGGQFDLTNFGTISRRELVSASGGIAKQIARLPDGAHVEFRLIP